MRDKNMPFGSLSLYERATQEIHRRDYGDLVQLRAGQKEFLTFRLGRELYAADLKGILEVTRPGAITPVPFSPPWMLGVMLLRGNVVPILHVSRLLGLDASEHQTSASATISRVLVVSRNRESRIGLLVDEVHEVIAVPDQDLGPVPPTVHGPGAEYVVGVARKGTTLYVLLNHVRVAAQEVGP